MQKVKTVDMTAIVAEYADKWIALSDDLTEVYASGNTAEEVLAEAKSLGYPEAIISRFPPSEISLAY